MIKPDQWASLFEMAHGHKRSPPEFSNAEKASFALESLGDISAEKIQQVRVAAFEKLNGHKPSLQEQVTDLTPAKIQDINQKVSYLQQLIGQARLRMQQAQPANDSTV